MLFHRRRFLQLGLVLAGARGAVAAPGSAPEAVPVPEPAQVPAAAAARPLVLRNLHTDEVLSCRYGGEAADAADTMQRVATLLRDFRTGDAHPIDPALLDILGDVAAGCGADPVFDVISGYRSPLTNEMLRSRSGGVAVRSLHMEGRAIDVRLCGVHCTDLAERAQLLARGGVGFYGRSDFVHLDTGAVRTWRG
jgi:uncharacterized protein YcbK (DUF882 family)